MTLLQDHKYNCEVDLPHLAQDCLEDACSEESQAYQRDEIPFWEKFHARDNATARFYKERR
jgi:hypothetical protein